MGYYQLQWTYYLWAFWLSNVILKSSFSALFDWSIFSAYYSRLGQAAISLAKKNLYGLLMRVSYSLDTLHVTQPIVLKQWMKKCRRSLLCFHTLHFNGHFPGGSELADTRMFPFWILLEVVVTTAAIRRAKFQSNRHHQQTQHPVFL